jgi:selenocysteine-specific translation elongation factor
VPIDHFFNVKGVGTVILGYVTHGRIEKHDELKVLPTDRKALVRSIQKHDDDYDDAVRGDRVGLALKNVDVEQLDRGYVLTADDRVKSDSKVTAEAEWSTTGRRRSRRAWSFTSATGCSSSALAWKR